MLNRYQNISQELKYKDAIKTAIKIYQDVNGSDELPLELGQLLELFLEDRNALLEKCSRLEKELKEFKASDLELARQYKQFLVGHGTNTGKEGIPDETA